MLFLLRMRCGGRPAGGFPASVMSCAVGIPNGPRGGANWLRPAPSLYHLTDAELRDMGLSRGEIPAVVSGTYCRD